MKTVEFKPKHCFMHGSQCTRNWEPLPAGYWLVNEYISRLFNLPKQLPSRAWLTLSKKQYRGSSITLSTNGDEIYADGEYLVRCAEWSRRLRRLIAKHGPYLTLEYEV